MHLHTICCSYASTGEDGTLRAAATKAGVPAICVEMGDPQLFEYTYIRYPACLVLSLQLSPPESSARVAPDALHRRTNIGIFNILVYLRMLDRDNDEDKYACRLAVFACDRSMVGHRAICPGTNW